MSQFREVYEINGIDRIKKDKINRDGDMEFLVSWRGYGPFWDTWKAVSYFEGKGTTLSTWLKQTPTAIPVADDIEFVVSEVQGGYMVKRQGKKPHEHEWLPDKMIPDDLIQQMDDFEENLDNISDDMEIDQDSSATVATSLPETAALTATPISVDTTSTTTEADIESQNHGTEASAVREDEYTGGIESENFEFAALQQLGGDEQMDGMKSDVPETDEATMLDQTYDPAGNFETAHGQNVAPIAEQPVRQGFDMEGMNDYFDFAAYEETPTENGNHETKATGTSDLGVCTDQVSAGHVAKTHICMDSNHDHAQWRISCKECVAEAESQCKPYDVHVYQTGVVFRLGPKCNAAWKDVQGLDHLCNCKSLPRCGDCHMRKVLEFKNKLTEMYANGFDDAKCVGCEEKLDMFERKYMRCAVCLGLK